MIELRWLVISDWNGPRKILQYRQKYSKISFDDKSQLPEGKINDMWSDWQDIPEVKSK